MHSVTHVRMSVSTFYLLLSLPFPSPTREHEEIPLFSFAVWHCCCALPLSTALVHALTSLTTGEGRWLASSFSLASGFTPWDQSPYWYQNHHSETQIWSCSFYENICNVSRVPYDKVQTPPGGSVSYSIALASPLSWAISSSLFLSKWLHILLHAECITSLGII